MNFNDRIIHDDHQNHQDEALRPGVALWQGYGDDLDEK